MCPNNRNRSVSSYCFTTYCTSPTTPATKRRRRKGERQMESVWYLLMAIVIACTVKCSDAQRDSNVPLCLNNSTTTVSTMSLINQQQCPEGHYFNASLNCCATCSICAAGRIESVPCNRTHDTKCIPMCNNPFHYWSELDRQCVIDCAKCPLGECNGNKKCRCQDCMMGEACNIPVKSEVCTTYTPSPASSVTAPTVRNHNGPLAPVTMGLIAIGVVIGIIAFSSCFILFGVCTTNRRKGSENPGSEGSENGLVSGRGFTNSTRSSYMSGMGTSAFLNNQSMLELLKHSNTPVHHSNIISNNSIKTNGNIPQPTSNSIKFNQPRPVRTSYVVHMPIQHHPLRISSSPLSTEAVGTQAKSKETEIEQGLVTTV